MLKLGPFSSGNGPFHFSGGEAEEIEKPDHSDHFEGREELE